MADKDIVEKTLEAYNDVFADIVNVLLFKGERIIKEDDLEDAVSRSHYKVDNSKLHELERDVAKYWSMHNIRIAFLGIENQTGVDPDAPLRSIGYDGVEYRKQLLADFEKVVDEETEKTKTVKIRKPRFPVITLWLYFGYKEHWNKPLALYDCMSIYEPLKPYVNNYKINLFEIAYLTDEQVNMFQSDFRIVADYFVQMRKNNDYIPKPDKLKHVHEVLELMSVMTRDYRFEEIYKKAGKQVSTMCDALDKAIEQGREQGIEQGRTKGKELIITLNNILIDSGRMDDLVKASKDEDYLNKLIAELIPQSE